MSKVLVACEESQTVTKEFRLKGIEAYSCDIEDCSGGFTEWHIKGDVIPLLEEKWDMIIAFPPCTHLASSGAKWFEQKRKDGRQKQAIEFFMKIAEADCDKIAIENPIGVMSTYWRKPDQIIQPYQFGDPFTKTTCLWLKNLPPLIPTDIVDPGERVITKSGKSLPKWYSDIPPKGRSKKRSKTFSGIARAMANQWGKLINF